MNKTVLITGASRGIGASMAYEFAKNNYNVIINYNNSYDDALKLSQDINNKFNVSTLIVKADIQNEEEVKNMVDEAILKFTKIDVVVNNAAIAKDCEFVNKSKVDFLETYNVNVVGSFLVSKYVSKYMLEEKSGCIINISSTNAVDTYNTYSMDYI